MYQHAPRPAQYMHTQNAMRNSLFFMKWKYRVPNINIEPLQQQRESSNILIFNSSCAHDWSNLDERQRDNAGGKKEASSAFA